LSTTPRERALFLARCRDQYQSQKARARAAGKCLLYSLEDLRDLLEARLAEPVCPYCLGPFGAGTYALEHQVPLARGGKFTFRNLDVTCHDCGVIRGALDRQEFRELWGLMRTWPKPVQKEFVARLKAGAPLVARALPAPGALEWFTGSDEPHAPIDINRGEHTYKSRLKRKE
jgi:5-methylcytosine-specific restriction endonuclease McrA